MFLLYLFIIYLLYKLLIVYYNKKNIKKNIKKNCNKINYQPRIWNQYNNNIKKYNNCYAYAMRNLLYNRDSKPQPGDGVNCNNKKNMLVNGNYSCDNILHNIKCDYPNDILDLKNNTCPCNYYKVALFLDNSKPNKDYHFYRQDNNTWSHKAGNSAATNLDASNKLILDPYKADRNYIHSKNKNNYTIPCKTFCKKKNINIYLDT